MVARFLLSPGRIILSQPGYVVSTGMPDSQKIFDSNWNYSGVVLETGQAGGYGGQVTNDGSSTIINWRRNYGYAPVALITQLIDDGAWGPGWDIFYEECVCQIAIGNVPAQNKFSTVYADHAYLGSLIDFGRGPLRWQLFGVD